MQVLMQAKIISEIASFIIMYMVQMYFKLCNNRQHFVLLFSVHSY